MPITEKQRDNLVLAFKQLDSTELVKVAGLVYQTILESKLPSEKLMALGKLVFSKFPWNAIGNDMRYPFVKATEEFLLKELPALFEIVAEPAADTVATAPAAEAPPDFEGEIGGPSDDGDLAAMVDAAGGGNGSPNKKKEEKTKAPVAQQELPQVSEPRIAFETAAAPVALAEETEEAATATEDAAIAAAADDAEGEDDESAEEDAAAAEAAETVSEEAEAMAAAEVINPSNGEGASRAQS